jgi:hypothetical protein
MQHSASRDASRVGSFASNLNGSAKRVEMVCFSPAPWCRFQGAGSSLLLRQARECGCCSGWGRWSRLKCSCLLLWRECGRADCDFVDTLEYRYHDSRDKWWCMLGGMFGEAQHFLASSM